MTIEDRQKVMLANDLTTYINEKRTQDECIGFIDGYKAAFTNLKNSSLLVEEAKTETIGEINKEHIKLYTDKLPNFLTEDENIWLKNMEKDLIIKTLEKYKGKIKDAASELGISERTLYRKIKQYNINDQWLLYN